MDPTRRAVIGLDVGTGGARATAIDLAGSVLAESAARFPAEATAVAGACVEQDPLAWSAAAAHALHAVTDALPTSVTIEGVAVDATSGTFLIVDDNNRPVTAGLMYNDLRAADVAPEVATALDSVLAPYGIQIAASFALPKIVHVLRERPELARPGHRVVHQTDWIVGMLSGVYDTTDVSTALKTGADPGRLDWPAAIESLGVPLHLLPRLVLPGTPIGHVTSEAQRQTGLAAGTPVIAGCTDGTAGCLASGARTTGDLNVTLGTTLVFKAIAEQPLIDPHGAIYNHRHPAGGYLPGAASSTGAEWIETYHCGADLDKLSQAAHRHLPTCTIVYPLVKVGERFPIARPQARGFGMEAIADPALRLAAGMEAVAYLERMAIERFAALGLGIGPTIYATGGGSTNELWLRIRASVSRRAVSVPAHAGCSVGAAVLAAMPALGSCAEAVTRLVRGDRTVQPCREWMSQYDELYGRFQDAITHGRGDA